MRGFDELGAECLAAQGARFLAKARKLAHEHAGWAELLYEFETPLVSGRRPGQWLASQGGD